MIARLNVWVGGGGWLGFVCTLSIGPLSCYCRGSTKIQQSDSILDSRDYWITI